MGSIPVGSTKKIHNVKKERYEFFYIQRWIEMNELLSNLEKVHTTEISTVPTLLSIVLKKSKKKIAQ